jgi:Asp/Glu/hydantoin racemase
MKKLVALYTGQGLSGPLQALLNKEVPEMTLFNVIDDSIIYDVNLAGEVTKPVEMRMFQYFHIAQEMGADFILNTCSSVGEVVGHARKFIECPIIRIDEAMAVKAVDKYERIGVIATLPTTQKPTIHLLREKAQSSGKKVDIINGMAEGAYAALVSGKPELHDTLIEQAAEKLAEQVDCIVLAQGSMMRMQEKLKQITGKVILSSPVCCAEYLKTLL